MRACVWVLVASLGVAGCGDDDGGPPDAAAPDGAAPDGAAPDAAPADARAADAAAFTPGPALLLSEGSPNKDEDPFVLRAGDGRLLVAWFSERTGNGDIVLRASADGASWGALTAVTSGPDVDFFPTLTQGAGARFHAVWFRRPAAGGRGRIVYNHSDDPLRWNGAGEVDVTAPAGTTSDWTPSIAETGAGVLVVVFARDSCFPQPQPCFALWSARSSDRGATWTPAAPILAAAAQDHLPYLARTGADLTLVWNRYPSSATLPWLTASTDVALSSSPDGVAWAAARELTAEDGVVDIFPMLYDDHDGAAHTLWLSAGGAGMSVLELPLGGSVPRPVADLPGAGYSHHVAATPARGVYLGAWVAGSGNALDVYVRVFAH